MGFFSRTPKEEEPPPPVRDEYISNQVITSAGMPLTPSYIEEHGLQRTIDISINGSNASSAQVAFHYYLTLAELNFLVNYVSDSLRLVKLYVAEVDPSNPDAPERVADNHPAAEILRAWGGGSDGQAELLARIGMFLNVTGDCVVVGPSSASNFDEPFNRWRAFGPGSIYSRNGILWLKSNLMREVQVPDDSYSFRVWRENPYWWWNADSPTYSLFTTLRELELLNQHVHATAISRLQGAGILFVPEELTLPGDTMEVEGQDNDPFVRSLLDVAEVAIKNQDSAAARVPIIVRGPAAFGKDLHLIDFSTKFDEKISDLRKDSVRRLSLGFHVPPEILLGNENSAGWSAWQVSEAYLRSHLKPLVKLITTSLVEGWFNPALAYEGIKPSDSTKILTIAADFSALRVQTDPAKDFAALHDAGLISDDAYVHLLGYGEQERPDNKEKAFQILRDLINKNPNLAGYAINALRENYGLKSYLPVAPEVESTIRVSEKGDLTNLPNPEGQGTTPVPVQPAGAPSTPGQRSQDKQTSAPPALKPGDQSNNTPDNPPRPGAPKPPGTSGGR